MKIIDSNENYLIYDVTCNDGEEKEVFLREIYVKPELRGQGYGTQLMDILIKCHCEDEIHVTKCKNKVDPDIDWDRLYKFFNEKYNFTIRVFDDAGIAEVSLDGLSNRTLTILHDDLIY